MKKLIVILLVLSLMAGTCSAEKACLFFNGAAGDMKQVTLELEDRSIPALFEALQKVPFGEDVTSPVPAGYRLTGCYCASRFAALELEAVGSGAFDPKCIAESVLENTCAEHVAIAVNGRFIMNYPEDGLVPVFYPEAGGSYVAPVMRVPDGDVTADELLEMMTQAPDGYLCAVPGSLDGLQTSYEFADDGRRVLCVDFPMNVFTALEDTQESRWQFLAAVSLTLLTNLADTDCVRVSFDGQTVSGVPDRDGTLLRISDGLIDRNEFEGYIGSEAAEGCFVGCADAENVRALLVSVLPDTVKASDITAWSVEDGKAEISLSRAFYAACAGLDADAERELIYTMVDTVCNNTAAENVRFTVEGNAVETLAGRICLEGYLTPDDQ